MINKPEAAFTLFGDDERGYDFITAEGLRPLQELHLLHPGLLSLFLEITPQRVAEAPVEQRVQALLKSEKLKLSDKKATNLIQKAEERLQDYLHFEFKQSGRSIAIFYVPEQDLWWEYHLPVAMEDLLVWADRAYLAPLFLLMDEYEHFGIILVDRQRARFFLYYLNEVAEYGISEIDKTPPHMRSRAPRDLKHEHRLEEKYKQHFRHVAEIVTRFHDQQRWSWLALGGNEKNTSDLMKEIPQILHKKVAGTFRAPITASFNEIRDEVVAIERQVEERVEAERVEAVIVGAHKRKGAVLGLPETLLAIQEGKVMVLVTISGFHHNGWRCTQCGGLTVEPYGTSQSACPYCGGPLIEEKDLIDLAMQIVSRQGGLLEIVRGPVREQLNKQEPIGALLRY